MALVAAIPNARMYNFNNSHSSQHHDAITIVQKRNEYANTMITLNAALSTELQLKTFAELRAEKKGKRKKRYNGLQMNLKE